MKRAALLIPLVGFSFLLSSCSTPSKAPQVELFNGKDLSGWSYVLADPNVKMDQVWSVKDGVIHCKGDPIGAIYRGPSVQDFNLVVEYRWAPGEKPGNSGIFSRMDLPPTALPRTVEVQLMHGSAGDTIGLQGKKIASGQPRFFEIKAHPKAGDITGVKKTVDREKAPGEWNRVEILAKGDRYTVKVNGELVNEVTGVEIGSGPIGLQSEGGAIEFRRVSLTQVK